jgi:D-alanyl-D-alanine carboxypeptidase/D-alanyl-D-alanine-endopeptidase (penicillin-binding protein 4)
LSGGIETLVPDLSRRGVLLGLACALALPGHPALARAPARSPIPPPRPVRPGAGVARGPARPAASVAQLLSRANLGGTTGFAALDAETGELIEAHAPDEPLPPASVAKAPTALYALHHLGLEHRFITRLRSRGAIEGGVLRGDLILEGGGDPNLQTEHLAALAQALVARGLRRVEGRFLVDDRALPRIAAIDPEQVPQAGYSPAVSGLNLNFNRVHFAWAVGPNGARLELDARSPAEVPRVSVIRIAAADREQPIYTHRIDGGRELWTVARAALAGEGSRWLPVRQPALYAGDVLRALLVARGCTLPEPELGAGSGGPVLAEHRSDPLAGLMRDMLRFSTNLTAECAGLAASLQQGGPVPDLAASAARMNGWIASRLGVPGLAFADHSGLGAASRVTALGMARFFVAARRDGILPDLLRPHPMRDDRGREIPGHPVQVRAKTGTLSFASGLGGYARVRGGREVAFAIFSADLARRARIPPADRERPPGAQAWSGRARALQQDLIERWAALFG